MKNKRICLLTFMLYLSLLITGCSLGKDKDTEITPYQQISQEKAKEMIDSDQELTIVDVRRLDEYEEGHISGGILFTNEEITEEAAIELFSDKEQVLIIYCRSGNRSKQAAEKLASYGYTQIYEMGGINTWPYEIE